LEYKIIESGSKGNCLIIDDMMFDCGVNYKAIRQELYEIRYLFITHTHTDHLKLSTFNRIVRDFPRITTVGNWDVGYKVPLNETVGDYTVLELPDRKIQCFPCVHDVPTTGFAVTIGDESFIYATDTASLEHAPDMKFNYFFIESNHDENIIKQIRNTAVKQYGYDAWKGAMRHLSTQQSKAFYYMHRKDKDSLYIELHKSERFY